MHENRLSYLFKKSLNSSLSATEEAELQQLISEEGNKAQLEELVQEALEETPVEHKMDEQSASEVLNAIFFSDKQTSIPIYNNVVPMPGRRWWRPAAAAAILACMLTGGYIIYSRLHIPPQQVVKVEDVLPGSTKAQLTLSNGSVISLDNKGRQTIDQGNASIRQTGGELDYQPRNSESPLAYNTLRTPRGGQFKIKLPDGTNVWINAASSLKYPTAFTGSERTVEVTGEAYFEVAADHNKPFKVVINDHYAIYVLGTSFNIKAYADEQPFKTTLLAGAVKASLTGANEKSIII
ncbi:MAG TPA: FecR family protein, partial [Chitinophaga sp.]|nr:FecR family protein [Chitinophaga sp.]